MRMLVSMVCGVFFVFYSTIGQAAESPARESSITFADMGAAQSAMLRGLDGQQIVHFGVRLDESVMAARLTLRYSYSPALIPELSHLRIVLNKEVVATLPLPRQSVSGEATSEVSIDPRLFSDYNQLAIQLIGHYTRECEDALHSSLWASISNESRLQMTLRPLDLASDLSLLPAPFFDRRDNRRLVLPFVFGAKPSLETLDAAAVMASWFGVQASYRGATFPTLLDRVPTQHAVVFATNDSRPQGLDLPVVQQPMLRLMSHPTDAAIKLLVVQGKDAAQLREASAALALGQVLLTGTSAVVTQVDASERRPAYDAPNWVPSDRPVALGELVDAQADLQRTGHAPEPIRVNLRLPPDLLTWNRYGVPIDLKYRYTPMVEQDNSTLSIGINDNFVQAYRLRPGGKSSPTNRLVVPLLDISDIQERDRLVIPAFQIGANNQMQFTFALDYHKAGQCKDTLVDAVHMAIDPDSTIDISDFPHYVAMPNLALFANAGFPFTKYADLAETAVVMNDSYGAADIEQMLFLMGRLGRMTGTTGLRVEVTNTTGAPHFAGRDLLVLGGAAGDLLSQWKKDLPLLIEGSHRSLSSARALTRWTENLWGEERRLNTVSPWSVAFDAQGPMAAFVGFESPLQAGRSVIALTATSAEARGQAIAALQDEGLVRSIRGDITLVHGRDLGAYEVGGAYYVGELHWWVRLWMILSRHPVLVSIIGILAGLIVALWVYTFLRNAAARRLDAQ